MHESPYPPPSPVESMLEALHAAQAEGETAREAEVREAVEANLIARERVAGLA